jgi:phosphosulfolactate synthase
MVNASAPTFLRLPARSEKPRRAGITHVLDKGMPAAELEPLLGVCGAYVDVWKFGWGTAYLDPGLADKLAMLADSGVLACAGGTLLEVAWHQGAADAYLEWVGRAGFPCVEVSCGVAPMSADSKRDLILAAAERFVVLAEIGLKDPDATVDADDWAEAAKADLEAGATWVVTEGRESGTVGLYTPTGEVRTDVVEAVADAVGPASVIFEAPQKKQQTWLITRFGADVNLANVPPADALALESLRLGLRADTFHAAVPAPT